MLKNYNEKTQKVKMCIKTYLNLYGVMPTTDEMESWLGESYRPVINACPELRHVA